MQFELSISRLQNAIYFSIIAMPKKSHFTISAWSILESKGMGAIFQKKGKEMWKRGKIFANLSINVQNLKIF